MISLETLKATSSLILQFFYSYLGDFKKYV